MYCGSDHFHNIKIIVNGSNHDPFSLELDRILLTILIEYIFVASLVKINCFVDNYNLSDNIIISW